MTLPVVFRLAARREFDDSADWYEKRRVGLGEVFTSAVRDVLKTIASEPRRWGIVFEDIREAPVSGFPYYVYYREEESQFLVIAIFHASRDPGIWQSRA